MERPIAYPRILTAGDAAVVVEFGNEISPEINARIKTFHDILKDKKIPGIMDVIPTFRSVLINYEPAVLLYQDIVISIKETLQESGNVSETKKRIFRIPVCYGGIYGPDLKDVAEHAGMSEEEVIICHSKEPYLIYMLGFLPGFAYLGGLDPKLAIPRLQQPRKRIEAGSVGIGGEQTGIYPLVSPAGWRLIGRTPIKPYDPDRKIPILYEAGDYIQFDPITKEEYEIIEKQVAEGTYQCQIIE
ncbi:MAG: 5-oxoprolinase subunit PxpB [Lachnospiraceae bacterium]|nr:5-oxoprolinase subunit PxpB [Lachnospiraceae bacterium]